MRILVTGSRNYDRPFTIKAALADAVWDVPLAEGITLVHGAAPGADQICAEMVKPWGWTIESHPADWERHGKAAGPIRNQEMVDAGADICLAFPTAGSVGTWNCVRLATEAGIPTRVIEAE